MSGGKGKSLVLLLGAVLILRWGIGPVVPFALGLGLALLAEPGRRMLQRRLRLPHKIAAALSVGLTLLLSVLIVSLGITALINWLGRLTGRLPDLRTALEGVYRQVDGMIGAAPQPVQAVLRRTVEESFADGQDLLSKAAQQIPAVMADLVGRLSRWALQLGTAILAGFMISARLPGIKAWLKNKNPKWVSAFRDAKQALGGWGKAQLKLMGVTYLVVAAGLLLTGVKSGWLIALAVALVDAVPMLGTGTVLLPWALFAFVQGRAARAVGLCLTFGVALCLRTVLEPRLVGKQIGLDPLATLIAVYLGFQTAGILGMLSFPVMGAVGKRLWDSLFKNNL